MKFFDATIGSIHRETPETVTITLSIPTDYPSFKAGQYCAVEASFNGEVQRRSYSYSTAPHDGFVRFTVKQVEGGLFSVFFNSTAQSGQTLRISEPQGNFILPKGSGPRHLVFFAAGSGITPCYSIIREALHREPGSRVTLFYGNRTGKETIFKSELEELQSANANFKAVFVFSKEDAERPLFQGRLDFGKATELMGIYCSDAMSKEFFICGPGEMIQSVQNALEDGGISSDSIHTEFFATPKANPASADKSVSNGPANSGNAQVTAILDGGEFNFELEENGLSILDTLLDMGADAPYACKGGVCTSCKAKLLEGTVHMDDNYALTKKELAAGYILTCQSHPTAATVKITYDGV